MQSDWTRVADGTKPPFFVFTKPIQKSQQDDREYRLIRLDNGLQAMLVHDARADKAAASLDVAVGHLYDPDDMPGLAHFCEHLLFMGTEQFPRENEYSEYLAKNNGASNAYTATSNTNYYFSVATPALAGALERFAGFFHSPLFSPSCTSRELNAVDSEHKKNHQSDMWRIFQLNKHLSKEGHVWRKFGSGNRDSLLKAAKDLKAQGRLTESAAPSQYCASRMRLCIIGQESLDELSKMASTLFSPIPNRGRDALPMLPEHPFGPNESGTLVSVQTVMGFHALEISFPLEYQPTYWKHKPANFISHFVGHEGPGSLYSYLKGKGWVTSLSTGPQNIARGFNMFKITLHLTQEGFKNYREAIIASFKYLTLLRSSEFASYHQHEVSTIAATHFRFLEKKRPDDYATWISEHMAWPVPKELLISAPQLTWGWEQNGEVEKIREYLDSFRITKGRVVLMAKAEEHTELFANANWKNEPWYGTPYRVEKFDEDFIKRADAPNDIPELFLPAPNEFIPTNLDVEKREPLKRPHLIRDTPLSTVWHKKDDRFWVPKAHVIINLRSPVGNASPRASVMTRLYSDIVNDSLSEFSYDADLAGLTYNFLQHSGGLLVSMNGYNDKMVVLVQHVLEKIKALIVNPERLAVMKEQVKRDWENFYLGQSYSLSDYFGRYILTAQTWTVDERLAELSSVTPEEIQQHMKELLSQVHLKILVTGNIYKDEALKFADMAEESLGISPYSSVELNDRALLPPLASNVVYSAPIPNPNQANSALTYYVHFGSITDKRLRVTSSLITQIMSEPAFNVLRTQEQLGYIVSLSSWSLAGASEKGLRIVVQSERPPTYLEERVEAFLDTMKGAIENMSDVEFAEHKNGLEKKWLEAEKSLADETSRFSVHVNSGHWDFLRNENDAQLLKSITKDEVLAIFLTHVHPSSLTRSKLSVHMCSIKPRPKRVSVAASEAFTTLVREAELDVDQSSWKESLGDGTPLISDYINHWQQVIASKNSTEGKHLIDLIPGLVAKYPVEGEGKDRIHPDITYIKNLQTFRAGLKVSVDPGPMIQWGDLPVSRF
ncbi:Metalloenzyme, LuxS/M16 peptidase-like protein [Collybia nuda]|uniref:Metalloenzyme, LuxS/M16 peptidase-like protein n=1 Tax=Collybia nuda TaxID=64659 RepID=A0A9P5YFX5_9AGAR|nr:Metalloenzyme, LuxS/M16 peptidase-like protein [Collybia nuda]